MAVPLAALGHDGTAQRIANCDKHQYPGTDPLAQEATITLIRSCSTLNLTIDEYLSTFGLSRPRLNVLAALCHAPEGQLRMSEIGTWLNVAKPKVTALVDG
ncbi:MAG TPA: hypothetical protein VMV93_07675, partial [Chloroflexota bacterium]|nr:hypothetical protein [Chloroflexota bacterium]